MNKDRVLIWGAGAIGGTMGAILHRKGHDVTLVDVNREHVELIRDPSRGLVIDGPEGTFTQVLNAFTPDELKGTWDKVLLVVKGQHTAAACKAIAPHLTPDGSVLSIQNGLCARTIDEVLGEGRGLASAINIMGDMMGPGRIRFGGHGAVGLGEFDGEITPRLLGFEKLLRDFDPNVQATPDVWSAVWSKLGFALMLVSQALGETSIVECFSRPELLPLWRQLGEEITQIAAAEGIHRHAFDGYDPDVFNNEVPESETAASIAATCAFNAKTSKTHSGIWRDLAINKRRTEVNGQMSPLITIGKQHGISTKTIERLVEMIAEIEDGKRIQSEDNLIELMNVASSIPIRNPIQIHQSINAK